MDSGSASCRRNLRRTPLATCLGIALALTAGHAASESSGPSPTPSSAPLRGFVRDANARTLRLNRARALPFPVRALPTRDPTAVPVTSCADDGSTGTLRAVVAAAVDGDVVDMSQLACSTITLAGGQIGVNVAHLTLQGPGQSALTIDANHAGRVLVAYGGGGSDMTLTLNDLTIANGFVGGDAGGVAAGGCINSTVVSPTNLIVLNRSTVTGCTAGDATATSFAEGGAINTYGSLTLNASTLSDNRATAPDGVQIAGGAVYAIQIVTLTDSTVTRNTATRLAPGAGAFALGGALYASQLAGGLSITGSTISDNHADDFAGGLFASTYSTDGSGRSMLLANSTVSGNTAGRASAIEVYVSTGTPFTIELRNSTVTGNASSVAGSCAMGVGGTAPGTVDLASSIIAGNSGAGGAPYDICTGLATSTLTGNHNLIGVSELPTPPDTISADPMLGPLQDNGGPTWTHALLPGSPAIDAGSNPDGLDFDQRGSGFPRVAGASADIGAFEASAPDDTVFSDGFDG